MGLTVLDLHPLTDRLAGLIAEGKWADASEQADLILKLTKAIRKHTEQMARRAFLGSLKARWETQSMITIDDVEMCYVATIKAKATPHRTPDFKKLRADFGGNCPVKGLMWFIEECNTGYAGHLERWEFRGEKDGKGFDFWADLLPGLLIKEKAPPAITPAA